MNASIQGARATDTSSIKKITAAIIREEIIT